MKLSSYPSNYIILFLETKICLMDIRLSIKVLTRSSAHVEDTRLEWVAHCRRGYMAAPHHPTPARRDLRCMWTQLSRSIYADHTSRTSRCMKATGLCSSCWLSSIRTYNSQRLLVRNRLFL